VFFKSSYLLESPKALSTWSINNKFILKNMWQI
jgi:hypothetical protein